MEDKNKVSKKTNGHISDFDRDSLWSLPLIMIPLQSSALQKTRLVKNNKLEGVVEIYSDARSGRGYVIPDHLNKYFGDISTDDINVVRKLSVLNSYDVYSLRISLRQIGINVVDHDDLKLSISKQSELQEYMKPFVSSLIVNIFDREQTESIDMQDGNWMNIFYNPDVNKTREHLRIIASKMNIDLQDVPSVIQKYGDVYLSVAYYRQCLDNIQPAISDFVKSTIEITQHQQIKNDFTTITGCKRMYQKIKKIQALINQQF